MRDLDWNKQNGLLPVIVQEHQTLQVLMLGYMSPEALQATEQSGYVIFYSRSKQRLWQKGESSGHRLKFISLEADCDRDTLLIQASPEGPTCHTGRASCFPRAPADFLVKLSQLIEHREHQVGESSYTRQLLESGIARIAQKVGEEGVETALAAVTRDNDGLLNEAADLFYHLLVLLRAKGLSQSDLTERLKFRHENK